MTSQPSRRGGATKKVLGGLVAVCVIAGGWFGVRAWRGGDAAAPSYQTAQVSRERVASQVTATGTLSPVVEVQVGSQVSGRIQELGADFNSTVKKGQVIARIDPQLFETEVARAKANLTSANAGVTRAQADMRDAKQKWERARSMVEQGLLPRAEEETSRATYDAAVASVSSAKASLQQARAGLQQAQTNLAYTTIVSPIDGVVISRDVDVGQTVAASLQAPTLFTIAEDLAKMEVHTSVAESDVGSLANGMAVEFTVDAFPRDRFRGEVKQVRYSPTTVSNVVTYDAVVAVDNPDLKLRPGMTANVTFVTEERADALAVPNTALRFTPAPEVPGVAAAGQAAPRLARNARVIWRMSPSGTLEPVRVEIGISDGQRTEITGGELREGDNVIIGAGDGAAGAGAPPGGGRRGPPRFL